MAAAVLVRDALNYTANVFNQARNVLRLVDAKNVKTPTLKVVLMEIVRRRLTKFCLEILKRSTKISLSWIAARTSVSYVDA